MAVAGLSTLGIKLAYGVESTAGTKPTTFLQLERVNTISGISLETEQIDASALEDLTSRYIAGRQNSGGNWGITFNYTPEVETQLKAMITAYNGVKASGKALWLEVYSDQLGTSAFFVRCQPPQKIPMPEFGQNSVLTVEITMTIEEYIGTDTAVVPA